MSFFKKIVDWFHDDEEDAVEAYDQEPRPQKPKNNKSRPQAGIDTGTETGLETRIQYKYPKDNFKFPVISDEEIKRLNERKKMQKTESRGTYSEGKEWTPVASALEEQLPPRAVKPLKKARQKSVQPTTVQPNNTPFRRTEIPSPIYGFQNRATGTKRQKTVEYELSTQPTLDSVLALMKGKGANEAVKKTDGASVNEGSFEERNHDWIEERLATAEEMALIQQAEKPVHEAVTVDMPDSRQEEINAPAQSTLFHSSDEKESMLETIHGEIVDGTDATAVSESAGFDMTVEEETDAVAAEIIEEEVVLETEETEEIYAQEPAVPEEEESLGFTEMDDSELTDEVMEANTEEIHEAMEMPLAKSLGSSDSVEMEPIALVTNEAVLVSEPGVEERTVHPSSDAVQETMEPAEAKLHVISETESEPAVVQETTKGQVETEPSVEQAAEPKLEVISNRNEEDEERKAERARRIQERRKHIPFNVLMLKQDKAKLSRQSEEKAGQAQQEPFVLADKKKLTDSYSYPDISILKPKMAVQEDSDWLAEQADLLDQTLEQFNVKAKVFAYYQGPSVTRFEVQPEPGVKVSKITNLSDDLKLSLAAKDIRIEAPIPGKRMIGIEIPNLRTRPVYLREVLEENVFLQSESPLTTAVGLDISGNPIVTDLKKMPHGLVAGSTGSGKSVFINSILVSLLYKTDPSDVRLLLIDPKMVELAPYNHIPHLAAPVITDVKAATAALKWAVEEMDRRYELFAHSGARDIVRYNQKAIDSGQLEHKLPYLVIIIDELADLMMMSPADVEEAICRIAQKARACGIHLLVATQRPSVDVITGLIKANIPTRIAFSVSSQVDSRTILDQGGAEKLLGRGDMLFLENGTSKTVRLQGTFVTDDEIERVVQHVKEQAKPNYLFEPADLVKHADVQEEKDELYFEVCEFAVEMGGASISSIQRRFRIGYNRAARLIDIMEREGVLSEARGSKPREVLISEADLEAIQDSNLSY
ncbi:DNA translocase FtsK [Pradoshia sp.]